MAARGGIRFCRGCGRHRLVSSGDIVGRGGERRRHGCLGISDRLLWHAPGSGGKWPCRRRLSAPCCWSWQAQVAQILASGRGGGHPCPGVRGSCVRPSAWISPLLKPLPSCDGLVSRCRPKRSQGVRIPPLRFRTRFGMGFRRQWRDGRVRGKDAGSERSGATDATEDNASCRLVQARRPQLHCETGSRESQNWLVGPGPEGRFLRLSGSPLHGISWAEGEPTGDQRAAGQDPRLGTEARLPGSDR